MTRWMEWYKQPVRHLPMPFRSNVHPVRPHMRPLQPTGALNTLDWPGLRVKPPPPKLFPGVTAGQIVSLQSFIIVNTLAASDKFDPEYNINVCHVFSNGNSMN